MIALLNVLALSNFLAISYQDIRERQIYILLLVSLAVLLASIHFIMWDTWYLFGLNIAINLLLVGSIIIVLYLVTRGLFKKSFLDHSFGKGDLILFLALALAHPTMTFVVLFACALIFSLIMAFVLQPRIKEIPLAGYMCLFYTIILVLAWLPGFPSLYTI